MLNSIVGVIAIVLLWLASGCVVAARQLPENPVILVADPAPNSEHRPVEKRRGAAAKTAKEQTPRENPLDSVFRAVGKLKNSTPEESDRDWANAWTPESTTPAARSRPMTLSEIESIRRQLQPCWNFPVGEQDAGSLRVLIRIWLNRDGSVRDARVLDQARLDGDSKLREAAEAGLRAVNNPRCSPLKLPPEKFDQWKILTIDFDPSKLSSGTTSQIRKRERTPTEAANGERAVPRRRLTCGGWNTREFFRRAGPEKVAQCIATGADPNARSINGWTPLHQVAANSTKSSVVAALVAAGANIADRNIEGWTPLHVAVANGAIPSMIAALLRAGGNPKARAIAGITPLHVAARYSATPSLVTRLVKAGADPAARTQSGWTPLYVATRYNNTPLIAALLKIGVDSRAPDKDGVTPLHVAAKYGKSHSVIGALVQAGANPNVRDKDGWTPLHFAVSNKNMPSIITRLVRAGANPNERDKDGWAPLHVAAATDGTPSIVAALLKAGANPRAATEKSTWQLGGGKGWTPLHLAARSSKTPLVVAALLDAGADAKARTDDGRTPWDLIETNFALKGTDVYWRLNNKRFE